MRELIVRLICDDEEWSRALAFINEIAFESHRASPPPPPQYIFGAYCGDELVGTIGLDFGEVDRPLPIEAHWEFDRENTPLPFKREAMVEIGRWMASRRGVSTILFYAATIFALSHGRYYCIAEMKSKIAEHATSKLGYIMLPVQGARVLLERIREDGLPYYLDDPPSLYMLRVEQMHQAVRLVTPPLYSAEFQFILPTQK